MKRSILFFFILPCIFCLQLVAQEIKIVSTTGMIADLVSNLVADDILAHQMMSSGIDPHTYKPSARDLKRIQQAKVILYNGFHLEANLTRIFEKLPKAMPICEKIDEVHLLAGDYGITDPHLWMSVALWQYCVDEASKILQNEFPKFSQKILTNTKIYQAQLSKLVEWSLQQVARVPKAKRILVTAHDAFRYFGKAYDFDVRGIQGISTVSEAGIKDIKNMADFVAIEKVPVIFVESSVAWHNVIALQQAVIARGFQVKIGESLYSDSMGAKGSGKDTYVTMMKHNISTIIEALVKKQ